MWNSWQTPRNLLNQSRVGFPSVQKLLISKHETLPKSGRFLQSFFCLKLVSSRVQLCQAYPRRAALTSFSEAGQKGLLKSGYPMNIDSKIKCGLWCKIAIHVLKIGLSCLFLRVWIFTHQMPVWSPKLS